MTQKYSEETIVIMQADFEKHRSEPDVTVDEYVRRIRIELGKSLEDKTPVYLDKCYWIRIRDVAMGRSNDTDIATVLSLLKEGVLKNTIFCPISETLFVELLKQEDIQTRRVTAELIDELSLGVTLAREDERVGTELAHLFYSQGRRESVNPLHWLVWDKLCYVLGMVHPTQTGFDPKTELLVQKAFVDRLWDISLTEMLDVLAAGKPPPKVDFDDLANKLNRGSRDHAGEIRSFKQAYLSEISGALSLYMVRALDILENMFNKSTGAQSALTSTERKEYERQLHIFFVTAFRKGKLATKLPTLHVLAMCHAAIRWDKKRQLNGNDIYDFHHAAAALSYCAVFLTEKPLQILVTSKHVALDRELGCVVVSALPETVECLKKYIS